MEIFFPAQPLGSSRLLPLRLGRSRLFLFRLGRSSLLLRLGKESCLPIRLGKKSMLPIRLEKASRGAGAAGGVRRLSPSSPRRRRDEKDSRLIGQLALLYTLCNHKAQTIPVHSGLFRFHDVVVLSVRIAWEVSGAEIIAKNCFPGILRNRPEQAGTVISRKIPE
jgi:hypothetical protein